MDPSASPTVSPETLGCRLDGGGPDGLRRRAALDALVNDVLTPYEVLYLHRALSRRRTELVFAGLENLPAELFNLISSHLRLVDIASCIQVNKVWNAIWTSEYAVHGMLHHFFPGLLQTTQAKGAMPEDAWVLLQQAARHRWRFQCGSQCSRRIFPKSYRLGNSFSYTNPAQIRVFEPVYCSGRVVWQKDGRHFLIDNLHGMDRHVLRWGEGVLTGTELSLLAITQKLVVLTGGRRGSGKPMLIIYHFDEKRFLNVSLPASIISLHGDDLKIGLHLHGSLDKLAPATTMYIWQWGGPLQLVEPSQATLERVSNLRDILPRGFLFHPFEKDVFSAVWTIHKPTEVDHSQETGARSWHSLPPGACPKLTVLVDEYKDGKPLLHTRHSHIDWRMRTAEFGMTLLDTNWCQETDSHGGYDLCQARISNVTTEYSQHPRNEFLNFNSVTRSFIIRTKGGADCFPDDLLRTPWIDAAQAGPGPWDSESTMLVVETPRDVPVLSHRMPLGGHGRVAFSFNEPGQHLSDQTGPMMACDDEFMVIRDQGDNCHGYTVWGYGRMLKYSMV